MPPSKLWVLAGATQAVVGKARCPNQGQHIRSVFHQSRRGFGLPKFINELKAALMGAIANSVTLFRRVVSWTSNSSRRALLEWYDHQRFSNSPPVDASPWVIRTSSARMSWSSPPAASSCCLLQASCLLWTNRTNGRFPCGHEIHLLWGGNREVGGQFRVRQGASYTSTLRVSDVPSLPQMSTLYTAYDPEVVTSMVWVSSPVDHV